VVPEGGHNFIPAIFGYEIRIYKNTNRKKRIPFSIVVETEAVLETEKDKDLDYYSFT
jgi:hypothetical protein